MGRAAAAGRKTQQQIRDKIRKLSQTQRKCSNKYSKNAAKYSKMKQNRERRRKNIGQISKTKQKRGKIQHSTAKWRKTGSRLQQYGTKLRKTQRKLQQDNSLVAQGGLSVQILDSTCRPRARTCDFHLAVGTLRSLAAPPRARGAPKLSRPRGGAPKRGA